VIVFQHFLSMEVHKMCHIVVVFDFVVDFVPDFENFLNHKNG